MAHCQRPGNPLPVGGIGFPASGKGRPGLAQRPEEAVYIGVFWGSANPSMWFSSWAKLDSHRIIHGWNGISTL